MRFVKTQSSLVENLKRFIQFLGRGTKDVQTATQVTPYGIDSNPVKDMIAVYAPTSENGRGVIVGYINKNNIAGIGENRFFSTNEDGEEQTYIYLKNDGFIDILGTNDNLAAYSQIAASVNELKNDLTTLKNAFNTWVPVASDGGAALKVDTATWSGSPLVEDISKSKIEKIRTEKPSE